MWQASSKLFNYMKYPVVMLWKKKLYTKNNLYLLYTWKRSLRSNITGHLKSTLMYIMSCGYIFREYVMIVSCSSIYVYNSERLGYSELNYNYSNKPIYMLLGSNKYETRIFGI